MARPYSLIMGWLGGVKEFFLWGGGNFVDLWMFFSDMKHVLFSLMLSVVAFGAGAEELALKIYSRVPDTTRVAKHTIVAVTSPGAEASIGGEAVHVYRTGSFGAEVSLRPGENLIPVEARLGSESARRELKIFYDTVPKTPLPYKAELEMRFPEPRYVRTRAGAYLQYGNGDDRLGGSKMGFVDEGIVLKAIGDKGSLYCVRLGEGRVGYIPKILTVEAVAPEPAGAVNTGSWSVADAGDTDRITVSLPRRLAYQYTTDLEPSTIAVDIFGATDNSNWITQRTTELGIVDYVDFRQVSSDIYRVIIRLKDKYQWGFHVGYESDGTALTIDVRHRPKSLALRDLTIGLDAGHGGEYPGAVSPSGLVEKDVNLDIIRHIRREGGDDAHGRHGALDGRAQAHLARGEGRPGRERAQQFRGRGARLAGDGGAVQASVLPAACTGRDGTAPRDGASAVRNCAELQLLAERSDGISGGAGGGDVHEFSPGGGAACGPGVPEKGGGENRGGPRRLPARGREKIIS